MHAADYKDRPFSAAGYNCSKGTSQEKQSQEKGNTSCNNAETSILKTYAEGHMVSASHMHIENRTTSPSQTTDQDRASTSLLQTRVEEATCAPSSTPSPLAEVAPPSPTKVQNSVDSSLSLCDSGSESSYITRQSKNTIELQPEENESPKISLQKRGGIAVEASHNIAIIIPDTHVSELAKTSSKDLDGPKDASLSPACSNGCKTCGQIEPGDAGDNRKKPGEPSVSARKDAADVSVSSSTSSLESHKPHHNSMSSEEEEDSKKHEQSPAGEKYIGMKKKHILCPKVLPPTWEMIISTAVSVGLSVDAVTRAFCSDPVDLPDKPRYV